MNRITARVPWSAVGARIEASTMAFYVTIVLLATTSLLDDHDLEEVGVLALVWGESLGLTLAHFFAFVLAVNLVHGSTAEVHWRVAREQVSGALSVAAVCTIPVLLLPKSAELDGVRLILALVLGAAGFAAARSTGASRRRSLVLAGLVLVAGLLVAVVKNLVAGH